MPVTEADIQSTKMVKHADPFRREIYPIPEALEEEWVECLQRFEDLRNRTEPWRIKAGLDAPRVALFSA